MLPPKLPVQHAPVCRGRNGLHHPAWERRGVETDALSRYLTSTLFPTQPAGTTQHFRASRATPQRKRAIPMAFPNAPTI